MPPQSDVLAISTSCAGMSHNACQPPRNRSAAGRGVSSRVEALQGAWPV